MITLAQFLQTKGDSPWMVSPETSMDEALHLMIEKDVEVLVVVEGNRPVGLLSEREYVRHLSDSAPKDMPVRALMNTQVFCVDAEQVIEECMALMLEKQLRHLLVQVRERVVGAISMLDLVQAAVADHKFVTPPPNGQIPENIY